ncbi:MAG: hypothetical protein AAF216_09085 [Pseudomonadota bacterium]
MADGSGMKISPKSASACISLDAAIAQLEAGEASDPFSVDLGAGQIARIDPLDGGPAVLARLKAHRTLLALARARTNTPATKPSPLLVDSHAKALLDAVKKAR